MLYTSQRAYAKHRGVNVNAVGEAIRSGRLVKCIVLDGFGTKKIGDVALADEEWERNTDAQRRVNAAGGVVTPALEVPPGAKVVIKRETIAPVEDNATATERLKSAQADLAELKYAEAAGELVPADDVLREWADLLSQVRTKMLGIPTALKQAIPSLTVADVVLIENAICTALEDVVAVEIEP